MNISTKAWTVAYKIMGAAIALMVLGAIVLVSLNNAQLRAENQDMYADLQASQENAQSLYEQLLSEGVEPEGEPPADVTPGPTGDPGPRGKGAQADPPAMTAHLDRPGCPAPPALPDPMGRRATPARPARWGRPVRPAHRRPRTAGPTRCRRPRNPVALLRRHHRPLDGHLHRHHDRRRGRVQNPNP